MRPSRAVASLLALALLALAPAASGAEVLLHAVSFPEGARVDVPFAGNGRSPQGATLEAEVRAEGARTRIALARRRYGALGLPVGARPEKPSGASGALPQLRDQRAA